MKYVLKKELLSYFNNLSGYIYISLFFSVNSYYFVVSNLMAGQNNVAEYFQSMSTTIMFLIPILTMKVYSEEKKHKTDQLLFTLPLNIYSLMLAKFLATFIIFLMGVFSTILFVVILSFFGQVDYLIVLSSYLGIILAGSSFLSFGIFISSLTENQATASIITFSILFFFNIVVYAKNYINNPIVLKTIDVIAIFERYKLFTIGIFDFEAVVYYLSIVFLFFSLTKVSLTKHNI
ncbi:MAG: ABC transporter permease [Clostridiaceae bacterium]|nr:ABC transporter permease [Clostridiaceae bacterium]